jgi:chromosome segregation ATPase
VNSITLVPVVVAIVGALAAYFAAARKLSGKVQTSEASELWEESRSMRAELTRRNEFLRESIDNCQVEIRSLNLRIDELDKKNFTLHMQNGDLSRLVEQHESTIAAQAIQIRSLEDERTALKQANFALERRIAELEKA